ncbi:MAG: hypothetical protein KGS10_17485 [Chloroflexi bacterium]|jgi:hypothetical protein|nr:hypothetical protein [Chloroflexota bacterium]
MSSPEDSIFIPFGTDYLTLNETIHIVCALILLAERLDDPQAAATIRTLANRCLDQTERNLT